MEIGIDSFAWAMQRQDASLPMDPVEALAALLNRIVLADQVGLDVFGIGEHHRAEFLDAAPTVILAAAAARTTRIRLTSAVTVLSAIDPVRAFQAYATLDLLSKGRAEMVVGRGSSVEAFPLFGYDLADYDALFAEKLDLLLALRADKVVSWSGRFRPALREQPVYPRPVQLVLPIWLGVGGTPASFARAGTLGLPLMVAIIGGDTHRFRPLVDLYREAGRRAGHPPAQLKVGLHSPGYVAATTQQATAEYYPGYAETMTRVGRERGWPPVTPASFEALARPTGALLIGSPAQVAEKILAHSAALGGIDRVCFQMDGGGLSDAHLRRSIELMGSHVAPLLREG